MRPDFDDIVFKGLNKDYGAYDLRKRYPSILSLAIILAVITGSSAVMIPYFIYKYQTKNNPDSIRYVTVENLFAADEPGGLPPPPAPVAPAQTKSIAKLIAPVEKYLAPEIVDTVPLFEKTLATPTDSVTKGVVADETAAGAVNGTSLSSGSGSGKGGQGGDGNGNGLFTKVEVMPTFKGGDINKFREWVQKKTKYPQIATANGIQGKVYITFVIETDGSVSNVKVVRGVDPIIDNEALKSVMSSPKWSPGMNKGKAVRVSYLITVNFEL